MTKMHQSDGHDKIEFKKLKKMLRQLIRECETGQTVPMYLEQEYVGVNLDEEPSENPTIVPGNSETITFVFHRQIGPWEVLN